MYAARQGLNKNVIRPTRHFNRVTQKSRLKNPLTTRLRPAETDLAKRNLKRFESISNLLFRLAQHNSSYDLVEPITPQAALLVGLQ